MYLFKSPIVSWRRGPCRLLSFKGVKCPSREHKPQFVPFLEKTFSSGELKLGSSVEAWEEVVWPSCKVRLHSSSLRGVARRRARNRSVSPSGSPDPWAAVPTVGSLVGAGDPGAGAVI
ncbi:hypothetical protein Taro_049562, partial [Colocasia esculenta]|nr:hypothetical protein [Colocasia esculenta]